MEESTVQWSCKSADAKRTLHVCCSYSETYKYCIKIRCQDTTNKVWEDLACLKVKKSKDIPVAGHEGP
jgi:hypothetical protein